MSNIKSGENLTSESWWDARYAVKSKQTVELFGDANDPAIQASAKRIRNQGRSVVILSRPDHETGLGICGQHLCSCTEPCKSIIHPSYKPL